MIASTPGTCVPGYALSPLRGYVFLATEWRQRIARGVSPEINRQNHRKPRSGDSELHTIAVATPWLI